MSVSTSGTNILVNGSPVQLRGIDIYYDGGGALTNAGAQAVLNEFPGITLLRVNCFDYPAPSAMAPYVNALTAAGCAVEIEDHNYPTCLTGAALTTSANWYAACATYFLNNPLVIFGTQNEPDTSSGNAAVDTEISTIYNAIRGTGNNTLILLCPIGGWAGQGYLTPSVYAGMTNVAWDLHYYAWAMRNAPSTNLQDAINGLADKVAQLVSVQNFPIVIGEYGVSSGVIVGDDVGGAQVVQAVQQSGYSSIAWAWTSGNASLPLLLNSTSGDPSKGLTTNFGVPVAQFIAAGSPLPTGVAPPSLSGTFISPGKGSFTLGSDTYTLDPSGNVTKNGTAIPGGSGTSLMALLGGVVYCQDGSSKIWYTLVGTTFVAATLSPSGTLITDALGFIVLNTTTIVTMTGVGGQIAFNGTVDAITAHVFLVLLRNGTLYQKVTQPGQPSTRLGASIAYGPDSTQWTPDLNGFTTAMGQGPTVFNTFADSSSTWANLDSQGQWTAAEIVKGAPTPAVPVVAIPMAVSNDTSADAAFQAIIAGTHDAAFTDIFNAYKSAGYPLIYIRPGWEFDGTWFKWAVTAANAADFASAFAHIASLAHAFTGMTIKVIWEPNYGSPYLSAMYPGNAAVDVIGTDGVGAGSGGPANTEAGDLSGSTWSFALATQMAVANNKPVCADELIDTPADVPSFAAAIASAWAAAPGLVVDHFSILNDPSQTMFSGDANASAAWRQCFANIATGMNWYSYSGTPGHWAGPIANDPRMATAVAPGTPAAPSASIPQVPVTVTWSAVTGTPTPTYTVQYRVTGTTPWTNGPAGLSALTATFNLAGGASYDFRIAAANSAGTTYGAVKTLAI